MKKNLLKVLLRINWVIIPCFLLITCRAWGYNNEGTFAIPPCLAAPNAPADGSTVGCASLPLTLSWPASSGAVEYDIYLGTNPIPPFFATVSSTSYTLPNLANGTYYWQIRPRNSDGTAAGCTVWRFTINCPPPSCIAAPNIPADGSTVSCPFLPLTLSWPAASGAAEYDIYLGTNPIPPFFATVSSTSYTLPNLANGTYYWQIRPRNFSGTASGCTVWSFIINCPPPSCIASPNIPANGSTVGCASLPLTLSWPASSGAAEYDIYLGTNPVPPYFATVSSTSYTLPNLVNGTYNWQIRPRNFSGTASGCTVWSFTINCPPPPCVMAPTTPVNGSYTGCQSAPQTLSWPAAAGATEYDIYLGTNPIPPYYATVSGTTYVTPNLTGNTYYWQIRPRNFTGTASGCTVWSFTNIDIAPPVFTSCPDNIVVSNAPGLCSNVVTWPTPTAVDNCSSTTIVQTAGPLSGSTLPVGTLTVAYKASDVYGNAQTCSFTVTVNDMEKPVINCPADILRGNDTGLCSAHISILGTPVYSDNCLVQSVTNNSPSTFPVGVNTVTWVVLDNHGNSAFCNQMVTIEDREKPKITCPVDILRGNDYGHCGAYIPYLGSPLFSDNCLVQGVSNNSPGTFPIGATTLTWLVSDNHGNTASCFQSVTIEDREYPVLTCPSNIQVKTDEGDCVATIGYAAKATDNCSGVVVDYSIEPFTTFNIGLTNVDVTATDGAGNAVNCSFQISVGTRTEVCNGLDDDCDGLVDESEDWARIAKQYGSDAITESEYGVSVDIDGDYAIVGSNQKNPTGQSIGSAYILFRDKNGANAWGQIAKLNAPGLQPGDNFGASVAISGGVAVVGSPLDDDPIGNEGSVYVFYQNPLNPAQWNFFKKITPLDHDAGDNFGASVALDGEHLVAGANLDDETAANAGAAYVFYRNQGGADNWGQVSKLLAITGNASDNMGVSVAIDGDYVVVGANGVDGLLPDAGAAYIFGRNQFGPDAWGQVAKMKASLSGQNDNFGGSVGISGPWAIVGADRNDLKGTDAGAAFVFYKNQNGVNNSWGQRNILVDYNGRAGDHYGCAVAIDGEYAIVGANGDDDHFGDDSGTGFVYLQQDNGWALVGNLEDGGGQTGDALGSCAALSKRTAILGAPFDDAHGINEGSALVFGGLCNRDERPENRSITLAASAATVRCFPVPFSSVLNIELKGMNAVDAQVVVLNTLGQVVATLYNGSIEGDMDLQWKPTQVAPGVYFLRVMADERMLTQTIVLEK